MKKHLLFLLACLFLMTGTVMAKIVKGRVIDSSDKEPIVGASIFVKSTKQGTITDIEGHFSLEIPRQCQNNHCFFCRYDNSRSCYHSRRNDNRAYGREPGT